MRQAQAGLNDFLALAARQPANARDVEVQVMADDSNGIETFWITPFKPLQQGYTGEGANQLQIVISVV